MKAIIVDDEAKARRVLELLLTENCPDVLIVESVGSVPAALRAIHEHHPDVVFLDIEMPGYTGFQLLELIEKPTFQIVFTTAYSEYAIQAFEVSAIDYLLKPIRIQKLIAAVEKVKAQITTQSLQASELSLQALQKNLEYGGVSRIALPMAEGLVFINTADIILLEAEGSYTSVYLVDDKKLLITRKIKDFEVLLEPHPDFYRTHRSFLINLRHVVRYQRGEKSLIYMSNGCEVQLSRERRDGFVEWANQLKV